MRRRIRGKKTYKAKPFNQKEGATKETKLCLPLLPPDQAVSDTVSLAVMYNVETILVTCMSDPSLIPNTRSPSSPPPSKKKKKKKKKKKRKRKKKMVASFFHGNKPD